MKSLIKPIIISALLITSYAQQSKAANSNAEGLNGKWNIVQNGTVIDAIDISLTVSSKNFSRFDFEQVSQTGNNKSSYQGILIDDYVIFNLINLGRTETYISKVDFDLSGGPGVKLATKLADCTVVGQANGAVDKKNRNRLATSSARCNGSTLNDTDVKSIKLVKDSIDLNTIPDAGSADPELVSNQDKVDTRLRGVWSIPLQKSSSKKILIKEPVADFFGYQFTYKLVDNSTKLINLSEDDFITGTRKGYFINNYMILNTSTFAKKKDELFVFKLTKTNGSGREFKLNNGDCFQLKKPVAGTLMCTPNEDSDFVKNITTRLDSLKISKSNTNIIINF